MLRTTGTATVKVAPDEARITIGVVTQAPTAEQAARQNAAQVDQVLEAVRAEIGDAGKLKTNNYSIFPEYNRPSRDGSAPEISGYRAQNMIEATLHDIAKVAAVIDVATKNGSNQVQGVNFGIRDETELRAKALQEAAQKARANANALAQALGLKVRRIVSVEEGGPTVVQPYRRAMPMAMAADVSTPIEAGEVEVQATVTMTVEFDQPVN
ncbi:MAG: SIMPL domain-containing protein [Bryobacterales bacterium]